MSRYVVRQIGSDEWGIVDTTTDQRIEEGFTTPWAAEEWTEDSSNHRALCDRAVRRQEAKGPPSCNLVCSKAIALGEARQ